jgi:hypothetical protein
LKTGNNKRAWEIAETIFRQCHSPYSLPEAIHPTTGGGAMGDGHHGWAAAEIILFLLDCLMSEEGTTLSIFKDVTAGMIPWGSNTSVQGIATSFGKAGCSLNYETEGKALCSLSLESLSEQKPGAVDIYLPFPIKRALTATHGVDLQMTTGQEKTKITCSSGSAVLLLER